ncbi:tetratricopeptide repeat protein [bacterium]|nr:tetratricopeptide repeat protein [bacterium]
MVLKIALYTLLGIVLTWVVYQIISILKTRQKESVLKDVSGLVSDGKTDQAIDVLEKSVANSFSEQGFMALLNLVLASGQYSKAVKLIDKVEKTGKASFTTKMMKGYAYFLSDDHKAAINIYEALLKEHPDKSDVVRSNIASIYLEEETHLEKAEEIYKDILENSQLTTTYNVLINLGYAQMKLGKLEEAIINEKTALEQIPKKGDFSSLFALAHYVIGVSYYKNNKADNAREELQIAKRYTNSDEFNNKIDQVLNNLISTT